jgi:2-polyprenyl-6-methoxyphenol hydroxylase-like FAD-dependent oxidoreductase
LRQVGWEVDVYERSRVELVGRGAGITTHPELLDALEKCGAGTRDLGVTVEKRITIAQWAGHWRAGVIHVKPAGLW